MGALTAAEVVSEGQLLAGRDDMTTQALGYLNRWLDSVAASWPWPVLQTEAIGVPVSAGVAGLEFGNGQVVTPRVHKILDNIWVYNSEKTMRNRVRMRHQLSSPIDRVSPDTYTGIPQTARIFWDPDETWIIQLEPIPDKAYLLTVPYLFIPAKITDAGEKPWYMNDETMVVAVAYKVSEYHNGIDHPVTNGFQQRLAGLVANDRVKYGSIGGVNDILTLSAARFKQKDSSR